MVWRVIMSWGGRSQMNSAPMWNNFAWPYAPTSLPPSTSLPLPQKWLEMCGVVTGRGWTIVCPDPLSAHAVERRGQVNNYQIYGISHLLTVFRGSMCECSCRVKLLIHLTLLFLAEGTGNQTIAAQITTANYVLSTVDTAQLNCRHQPPTFFKVI